MKGATMLRYTGNPFMDAALSALTAAAELTDVVEIDSDDLKSATERLKDVLLSDSALGIGVERSFNRGSLSQIFPNSKLVNPSVKDPKKAKEEYKKLLNGLLSKSMESGDKSCPICGQRFREGEQKVKADKFPLLRGISNFYPELSEGLEICPLCALSIQFFPFSVLRAGERGRLWFIHTQNARLAIAIAKRFGWEHFERLVASRQTLDFHGSWDTSGEGGAVLSLFFHLITEMPEHELSIFESPHPVTAYVFTNDNRIAYIRPIPVPNEILMFIGRLRHESSYALRRFHRELLTIPRDLKGKKRGQRAGRVATVAWAILEKRPILGHALDREQPYLWGGWVAHRTYLKEVRGMPAWKVNLLEDLGLKIARSEERRKWVSALRTESWHDLHGLFLRFVQEGWITHHDFYLIAPPGGDLYLGEARDVLLAVLYEYENLERKGEEFTPYESEEERPEPDEFYRRIEGIGARIVNSHPNPQRWTGELRRARRPQGIRGVYLKAVERDAMSWRDFTFLAPLEDMTSLYLRRDYLLAYLLDRLSLPPQEVEEEEVVQEV